MVIGGKNNQGRAQHKELNFIYVKTYNAVKREYTYKNWYHMLNYHNVHFKYLVILFVDCISVKLNKIYMQKSKWYEKIGMKLITGEENERHPNQDLLEGRVHVSVSPLSPRYCPWRVCRSPVVVV